MGRDEGGVLGVERARLWQCPDFEGKGYGALSLEKGKEGGLGGDEGVLREMGVLCASGRRVERRKHTHTISRRRTQPSRQMQQVMRVDDLVGRERDVRGDVVAADL